MHGVAMAFLEDVWTRNFLNFFASPLTIGEYLTGLVITSIASSAVGLTVMLLLATTIFGLSIFAYGIMIAPFLMVLLLFGVALGIGGSAMLLRLGPAAEWFIWPIPAIISPFVGVFYPISTLPRWMQWIARLLPPSYVFEGLRSIVHGGGASILTLLTAAFMALLYIVAACLVFARVHRHAVRTGLIARYSAESVS
jgi:ABC-2 type transport system permease protein